MQELVIFEPSKQEKTSSVSFAAGLKAEYHAKPPPNAISHPLSPLFTVDMKIDLKIWAFVEWYANLHLSGVCKMLQTFALHAEVYAWVKALLFFYFPESVALKNVPCILETWQFYLAGFFILIFFYSRAFSCRFRNSEVTIETISLLW